MATLLQHIFDGQSFDALAPKTQNTGDVIVVLASISDDIKAEHLARWLARQLKESVSQLRVDVQFHRLTRSFALQLSLSHVGLLKGAEFCRLKKPVKARFGGALRDFVYNDAHIFEHAGEAEFFTSAERSLILRRIVETIRAPASGLLIEPDYADGRAIVVPNGAALISMLRAHGVIQMLFPLHEPCELTALRSDWLAGGWLCRQPLNTIKAYFGVEVALYFAWLEHFTIALCVPSAMGIALVLFNCQWHHGNSKTDKNDTWNSDLAYALFALANCIWATAYGELWKRRQAELVFQWGDVPDGGGGESTDFASLLDEPRPEFKGDEMTHNPVSGALEPRRAAWKQALIRYGVAYPAMAICVIAVFALLFCMLRIQDAIHTRFDASPLRFVVYVPMVIQSLIILLADQLYRYLALFFNDLENYRTDEEFERLLITKIAIFQCVNALGPLLYVAFYLQNLQRLQEMLATLLITRQLLQNVGEVAGPLLCERLRVGYLSVVGSQESSEDQRRSTLSRVDQLRRIFEQFRRRRFQGTLPSDSANDLSRKSLDGSLRRRRHTLMTTPNDATPRQSEERLPNEDVSERSTVRHSSSDAELQSLMTDYTRPLDDYLEIFIQYGYVLLFAPAFPLAACCALVNNIFEMRIDAFRLCYTMRRPFPRRVRSIGAWQNAMKLMSMAGVMVNCVLIAQSGVVERLAPVGSSPLAQFVFLVVIEHFVFALHFIIDILIPDVPHWVLVFMAKAEHRRREACRVRPDVKIVKKVASLRAEEVGPMASTAAADALLAPEEVADQRNCNQRCITRRSSSRSDRIISRQKKRN